MPNVPWVFGNRQGAFGYTATLDALLDDTTHALASATFTTTVDAPDFTSTNASTTPVREVKVTGDTQNRFQTLANGQVAWGSGAATPDVTLSRTSANTLTLGTGDTFVADTGTFGVLSGSTSITGGSVTGTTGTFSSAVSGTTGTFTGAVSGTTGTFTGAVSGTSGTFTGAGTGLSVTNNGTIGGTLGVTNTLTAGSGSFATPTDTAILNAAGSAATFARSDHVHAQGTTETSWHVPINISVGAETVVQGTWSSTVDVAQSGNATFNNITGVAQNDEYTLVLSLAAGTYSLLALVSTGSNRGIITPTLDGVVGSTMDLYSAGLTQNVKKSSTGIVLTGGFKKRTLSIKMATKNASSSNYLHTVSHLALVRTA